MKILVHIYLHQQALSSRVHNMQGFYERIQKLSNSI